MLFVVLFGMLATGFSFTILTVAIKLIAKDMAVSEALATWTVSAPMLISAVCMPFLGKLGDLYGHRRIFLIGIAGSSAFALLCSVSWNIWSLIFFRVLSMSLAGATVPSAMALIFYSFDSEERMKAIGWWAMGGPASASIGLIAGGPLVDFFGWRSVFAFQVVAGVIAFAFALRTLPETGRRQARFDHLGNVLLMVSLSLLLFAIGSIAETGIDGSVKLGAALAGLVGLYFLFQVEAKVGEPIVPPFLLRQRNFVVPVSTSFICQAAYLGGFVITPLLLVESFGYSISLAALFMLARTLSLTIASPVGGRLAARVGERTGSIIGSAIQAFGLCLVGIGAYGLEIWTVGLGLILQGIGHGIALPPLTTIISYAVPSTLFGTASGVSRLATQIGASFGLSLFAALVSLESEVIELPEIFLLGGLVSALAILPALAISMEHRT